MRMNAEIREYAAQVAVQRYRRQDKTEIEEKLCELKQAHFVRNQELLTRILNHNLGEGFYENLLALEEKTEGVKLFDTHSSIIFYVETRKGDPEPIQVALYINTEVPLPFSLTRHSYSYENELLTLPIADELYQEYRDREESIESLSDEIREIRKEAHALQREVYATFRKFTTIKKLLASWPEAKELLPSWVDIEGNPAQLAVPVAYLNERIGLPTAVEREEE